MIEDQARFETAIARIDASNAEDPRTVLDEDREYPQELLYAQRMTERLGRFRPDASELLQLAVRCQHIRRWEIPRDTYPMDRKGYHQWRTRLYEFHGDTAAAVLREAGYDEDAASRVRDLLMKKGLESDPEMQALEDTACLVFLEHYFEDFAKEHDEEKITRILQRTWKKMSSDGRQAAGELPLSEAARKLIEKAVTGG